MSAEWGAHQLADWVKSMGHTEIDWLIEQAKQLPHHPIIVNIGAAAGVSTIAMLEARPDALIYSCEIDPGAGEYSSVERAGLDKSRVRRLGESKAAGNAFDSDWPRYPIDLLFIDGGHTENEAAGDVLAWLPHVKEGGVIVCHDYHNPNLPGVKMGIDKAIGNLEVIADVDTIRAYRK